MYTIHRGYRAPHRRTKLIITALVFSAIGGLSTLALVHKLPMFADTDKRLLSSQLRSIAPRNGAKISGKYRLAAKVEGLDPAAYRLYWSVDNGSWTEMKQVSSDASKEVTVDTRYWQTNKKSQKQSSYSIRYKAETVQGQSLGDTEVAVEVEDMPDVTTEIPQDTSPPAAQTPVAPVSSTPVPSTANPLQGLPLYADTYYTARDQVEAWKHTRPADAALIAKLAATPRAKWLGDWITNVEQETRNYITAANSGNQLAVFVPYNIPQRDCGQAAGAPNSDAYLSWISAIAKGIGSGRSAIILEPDAVPLTDCLSDANRNARYTILKESIRILKQNPNTTVYLDAGHARWRSAEDMAGKLKGAGIELADGFSLNVSNFITTAENTAYGERLSGLVGGKHFVIDTGRNGLGPTADLQWCNPPGRGAGASPTTTTNHPLIDAYLWVKAPGESDGNNQMYHGCNGGPAAGHWWGEYALGLMQRQTQ